MDKDEITASIASRMREIAEEQLWEEICAKHDAMIEELEKLMNLTQENRGVLLYDLNHNEELKKYLINNEELIKRIFKTGSWNYMIKTENRDPIGLLKSLFRDQQYELISKMKYVERGGEKHQYTQIYFLKDLNLNQHFK
jgi:dsDNA-binding SOS-regulon protein